MTRPRYDPIVITAETQIERMRERFSRRELIQLLGAAGAASIAGCGGGGQATPTPTAAGGGATPTPGEDTPMPEEDTPTATETATATETEAPDTPAPSGDVEVVDRLIPDVTTTNLEKFTPNPWNQENGFMPYYQNLWLSWAPGPFEAGPTVESAIDVFLPLATKQYTLDPRDNGITIEVRDDLEWGDGSEFTIDNVMMHADMLRAQLGVGVGARGETMLPLTMETTDEYTLEGTLLPGNTVIRFLSMMFQGNLRAVAKTHPVHHREYHEKLQDSTTDAATRTILQNLFSARFPQDVLPDFALNGFKATKWNPNEMVFESRPEFPWGLDFHPDQDRIFKGARWVSITEQTQPMNAAVGGQMAWITLPGKRAFDRLDSSKWRMLKREQSMADVLYFSPTSRWGRKTEKARAMRQGLAYLYDPEETAAINDLFVPYEQSTGFSGEDNFRQWVGDRFFQENFTDYGYAKSQYVYEGKGNAKFREAGFQKNKNGFWEDGEGVLASETTMRHAPTQGVTRPVLDNIIEQLNRNGVQAKGVVISDDTRFNNVATDYTTDLLFTTNQAEMRPHPYFGFREDTGIGSPDGLPATIGWWDWRNGYRRVEVPMPVGSPDGSLTTYDWDKNVTEMPQMTDRDAMKTRVRTLSWVNNQWVPGVYVIKFGVWTAANTDVYSFGSEFSQNLIAIGRGSQLMVHLPAGFMQPA